LKGFVNVDEPRVVLSIDGVISPIPEGGEKYGVQVISIQPPKAVLQRGRSRWTATFGIESRDRWSRSVRMKRAE